MPGSDRGRRRRGWRSVVIVAAGALAAVGCNDDGADTASTTPTAGSGADQLSADIDPAELAAELLRLDPAARLGGRTIVDPTPGATLQGTPGIDFIVAVADDQVIIAGGGHDQLGTLAARTTIDGGEGNDLLYGHGVESELIGGPGSDLLAGLGDGVTVRAGSGDHVHAHDDDADRILCETETTDLLIRVDPNDDVHTACGDVEPSAPATSASIPSLTVAGFARGPLQGAGPAAPAQVDGDGTNDRPFVAGCSSVTVVGRVPVCLVDTFPANQTGAFWWSGTVPAYRCPNTHPYLHRDHYNPPFTTIPSGVEIRQPADPWPVGISISGVLDTEVRGVSGDPIRWTGIATGGSASSATNWSDGPSWYQVVLHCTNDPAYGAKLSN